MSLVFDFMFWMFRIFVIVILLCGSYYYGYDRAESGYTMIPDVSAIITKEELYVKFDVLQRRLYESQP